MRPKDVVSRSNGFPTESDAAAHVTTKMKDIKYSIADFVGLNEKMLLMKLHDRKREARKVSSLVDDTCLRSLAHTYRYRESIY